MFGIHIYKDNSEGKKIRPGITIYPEAGITVILMTHSWDEATIRRLRYSSKIKRFIYSKETYTFEDMIKGYMTRHAYSYMKDLFFEERFKK